MTIQLSCTASEPNFFSTAGCRFPTFVTFTRKMSSVSPKDIEIPKEAVSSFVASSSAILRVLFAKQVLDHPRLLLPAQEMAAHSGHHLGAISRPTFAQRGGVDILIQQSIRIEFGAVALQLNQSKVGRLLRHEVFRKPRPMHGMAIYKQVHLPGTLQPQAPPDVDEHRCAKPALKDAEDHLPTIGDC